MGLPHNAPLVTTSAQSERKFAALVLQGSAKLGCDSVVVAPGLVASHSPRIELSADWKALFGRVDEQRFDRCRLFLSANAPTDRPGILDEENRWLCDRVETEWRCVGLTSVGLSCEYGWRLTGREAVEGVSIRESTAVDRIVSAPGTPAHFVITVPQLQQAENLSHVLRAVRGSGSLRRHWRALRAFELGLGTLDLTLRLHQLVRAIEGVVSIPHSRAARGNLSQRDYFAEKVSLMCESTDSREALREMYSTRGAVEHLEMPVREIHARPGKKLSAADAEVPFAELTFVAEGIARHALVRVFSEPGLRDAFSNEESILGFWRQSDEAIRDQWGSPFPFDDYRRHFDPRRAAEQLQHTRALRDHTRSVLERAPDSFWGKG
jgi:hypothetical protein